MLVKYRTKYYRIKKKLPYYDYKKKKIYKNNGEKYKNILKNQFWS